MTFSDSITTINMGAFSGCTSLTSVNIPTTITTIGHSAFFMCTSLSSINIPTSIITIDDSLGNLIYMSFIN
jgi:hypothetical protein